MRLNIIIFPELNAQKASLMKKPAKSVKLLFAGKILLFYSVLTLPHGFDAESDFSTLLIEFLWFFTKYLLISPFAGYIAK